MPDVSSVIGYASANTTDEHIRNKEGKTERPGLGIHLYSSLKPASKTNSKERQTSVFSKTSFQNQQQTSVFFSKTCFQKPTVKGGKHLNSSPLKPSQNMPMLQGEK